MCVFRQGHLHLCGFGLRVNRDICRACWGDTLPPPHKLHFMELYYKDLISEEASLEKLVDDLMLTVQGADEFVTSAGSSLDPARKQELLSRLERLKQTCFQLRTQAMATARATDKMLRRFPYSSIGLAFVAGILIGAVVRRPCRDKNS